MTHKIYSFTEEELLETKRKSFDDGLLHANPSSETEAFMDATKRGMEKLNIEFAVMKNELQNVNNQIKVNSDEHKEIFKKLDDFITSADTKYADRADFAFWKILLVSGMLLSIFLTVVGLLLEKASK